MPTADTTPLNISREERVRLRSLELYKRRGDRPGTPTDDWLCAEKQIRVIFFDAWLLKSISVDTLQAAESSGVRFWY
jgi:hypothetical protein